MGVSTGVVIYLGDNGSLSVSSDSDSFLKLKLLGAKVVANSAAGIYEIFKCSRMAYHRMYVFVENLKRTLKHL